MRKKSAGYIAEAEKAGHSEDVCTYVKCDLGMLKSGNIGPTGTKLPDPDLLLLSYTGCFTFMKWFEILKQEYKCPVVMLHVPYQPDGVITDEMRTYVVSSSASEVIPAHGADRRHQARIWTSSPLACRCRSRPRTIWSRSGRAPGTALRRFDGYFGGVYYVVRSSARSAGPRTP